MDEAREFIDSLPEKAQKKITYNLLKVEGGEMDKELFKKLKNSEIWEFRTLFNGTCYRLFAFWDTEIEGSGRGNPRDCEKNAENAQK